MLSTVVANAFWSEKCIVCIIWKGGHIEVLQTVSPDTLRCDTGVLQQNKRRNGAYTNPNEKQKVHFITHDYLS